MKKIRILLLILPFIIFSCSNNEYKYPADFNFQIEFKDMPRTLWAQVHDNSDDVKMSVYLPANYSSDKIFPLVLWLNGGDGGLGLNVNKLREVTSDKDFICVNFPLFKNQLDSVNADSSNYWNRIYLDHIEGDVIWTQYRQMLTKLFEIIPNIDKENTFMGGFSNGAHTTAILLSRDSAEIKHYFKNFFFIEGGEQLKDATVLRDNGCLVVVGNNNPREEIRDIYSRAEKAGANAEFYAMDSTGHNFPKQFYPVLNNWLNKCVK